MNTKSLGEILIEVSARHIHLSQPHLDELFGKGYKLTKLKDLSQPKLFAAQETITIQHKNKTIPRVRIIGPCRNQTQVELSLTDAFNLGIKIPIRASGDLNNTPGATLIGPKGKIDLDKGVIASYRHIHVSNKQALKLGIKNKDLIYVQTQGPRAIIFKKVLVRVDPSFSWAMHIDTDEGNAAGIIKSAKGTILKEINE